MNKNVFVNASHRETHFDTWLFQKIRYSKALSICAGVVVAVTFQQVIVNALENKQDMN